MSRVGKYPVSVPQGVTVAVSGQEVKMKGKLGEDKLVCGSDVTVELKDGKIWVKPNSETKKARMMWGTCRALLNNMAKGVSQGFSKNLEINGVGYRAQVQGKNLQLNLGFSHEVLFPIPGDVKIACEKPTSISITGVSRQRVGQVAAEIRAFRGPEPYKGKGIKYDTETIRRKEGKKK